MWGSHGEGPAGLQRERENRFKGDNAGADPARCHCSLAKLLGYSWLSLCLQSGRRCYLLQLEATRASLLQAVLRASPFFPWPSLLRSPCTREGTMLYRKQGDVSPQGLNAAGV